MTTRHGGRENSWDPRELRAVVRTAQFFYPRELRAVVRTAQFFVNGDRF